jgi:hypothetical protein
MKLIVKSIPNQFGAYKKIKNVYWGTRPFGFLFFIFFCIIKKGNMYKRDDPSYI